MLDNEKYKKLKEIKELLDNKKIEVKDIPNEYIHYLYIMYENQIKEDKYQIKEIEENIEEYKKMIQDAILYLKSNHIKDET